MNIHYLGHSTVLIDAGDHKLIIDPFIDGNPACPVKLSDVHADTVIVTHGHGDHFGSTLDLAKRGATVVSAVEITGYAQKHGAQRVIGANIGGWVKLPFGRAKFTPAWHSSSLPDGSYGGMPMGVIVEIDGKRVYHAGDTALFSDMRLVGDAGLDVALVPIGSHYTMDPDDAVKALELLRPKTAVPIHYNTFDLLRQDGDAFARRAADLGIDGRALKPGDTMAL